MPLHFVKLDLGDVPIRMRNLTIVMVGLGGGADKHGDAKARDQPGVAKAPDVVTDGDSAGGDDKDCNDNAEGNRGHMGIQINVNVVWDGNCNVMLQVMLAKSAKLTFDIKHIKLFGWQNILLSPLTSNLPVVSAIQSGDHDEVHGHSREDDECGPVNAVGGH